jgi:hypothetical protein
MPSRWERWHKPGKHAKAGRELDEGFAALREPLMVAAETTPADDPGKSSLDHPSPGLGTKALWEEFVPINLFAFGHQQATFGNGERLDRLDGPSQRDPGPGTEGPSIVAVAPDQLEAGK